MIDQDTGEVRTPFMRTPYNYDTDKTSQATGLECTEPTRTQQQFKDEVDINTIVERFGVTGEMPPPIAFPTEQEFEETFDFQSAMNITIQAREEFMKMPAKARARFMNDPQKFMEFIHDEGNIDEAVKLGLVTMRKKPEEPKPEEKEKPKE